MTAQPIVQLRPGLLAAAALMSALMGAWSCYDNDSKGAGLAVDVVGLPVCTWPAELNQTPGVPADGATGRCVAARAYLSCEGSTGGGQLCLSDNAMQCPPSGLIKGVTFSNCKDQCTAGEYAVACGGPGPGPWPSPPSGCRTLPSGPGGGTVSCCPCFYP